MRLHNLGPAYVKDEQEAGDSDRGKDLLDLEGHLLASRGRGGKRLEGKAAEGRSRGGVNHMTLGHVHRCPLPF
jgi:hypothetical protein